MKIYDKEIYKKEQNIKSIVLVIVVFLLGFFTGFVVNNPSKKVEQNQVENNTVIENTVQNENE